MALQMRPSPFFQLVGEFGVSESLNQQIDRLEEIYESESDPQERAFVPLADAHRRLGDLAKALAVIQEGLVTHPDFASAHMVAGWVHRSRKEPDDAMRSFERVLALDAENTLARSAIAELIDDQRAQTYRDKIAAKESGEAGRPVVPIASLAPGASDVGARPVIRIASLAPDQDARPVVSITSLAPGAPAETSAAPEAVAAGDARRAVPIASLAPGTPDEDARPVVSITSLGPGSPAETSAAPEAVAAGDARAVVPIVFLAPGAPDEDGPLVVPIPSLAPHVDDDAPEDPASVGGEIYTETLAELYAGQGATEKAIEVYQKLIADDPDNELMAKRLTELETLEPGSERQTVMIESLAPDGPDDAFPSMNRL